MLADERQSGIPIVAFEERQLPSFALEGRAYRARFLIHWWAIYFQGTHGSCVDSHSNELSTCVKRKTWMWQ
jgi:hypothetical protein